MAVSGRSMKQSLDWTVFEIGQPECQKAAGRGGQRSLRASYRGIHGLEFLENTGVIVLPLPDCWRSVRDIKIGRDE